MKRHKHSMSNYKLCTFSLGELVPVNWQEVYPGDSVQQATSMLMRFSPLLAPVMHPCIARIHHFFVPYRIIWEDFEEFITGGPDNDDASVHPTISSGGGGFSAGALMDYLGVPPSVANLTPNALPARAYNMIYNEFFRDQDLQTERAISLASGADSTTAVTLAKCAWEKDQFTSARPWPYKGPDITLPLGDRAPITGLGILESDRSFSDGSSSVRETGASAATTYNPSRIVQATDNAAHRLVVKGTADPGVPEIYADLSEATAPSAVSVREAFALLRAAEARALFGSRYIDYLRYLKVSPQDARLQRPEYLGGGRQVVSFSEVLQTGTNFDANSGVATMRGHGIAAARSNRYRRFIPEHGLIMTLVSVRPKTMYANGMPRKFSRATKEDYWQPELEMVGQQEVFNREVYAADSGPGDTFGWQDKYYELKHEMSQVAGDFRSTLNFWHVGRIFASDVTLNSSFVECDPATRIFASTSTDTLWVMVNNSVQMRRQLRKTAVGRIM